MRWLILAVIFLNDCATVTVCDYDLAGNGWLLSSQPPIKLITDRNKGSVWFTNSSGDFLACAELKSQRVCGNIYELYEREGDGEYTYSEVVCME